MLQTGYFERGLSKRFKKVNFIFIRSTCHLYVTGIYLCVMRMTLVYTRMSFVCTRLYSYVILMPLVCRSYVIRMSLACAFTMNR